MGKTSTEMSGGTKSSFLGHLTELRQRLIRGVLAVIVATIISFVFFKPIFYYLVLPAGNIDLIYIEMTEMIGTIMKVCLTSGTMLAMPYLVYQLLMFVSPALTRKEKKYIYFILPFVTLMFLGGIAFGYFFGTAVRYAFCHLLSGV